MSRAPLLGLGIVGAALLFLSGRARADSANAALSTIAPGEFDPDTSTPPILPDGALLLTDDTGYLPDPIEPPGYIENGVPDMAAINNNRAAFLYMIRSCEHRFPDDVENDAAYNTFYGGSRFANMASHPVLTGEKKGVPLPERFCKAAGYSSGVCVSTAAGAYQITKPTWQAVAAKYPPLPDFSPASQDEAALRILQSIGALKYVDSGDFATAIQVASKTWASLPGSRAGQHVRDPQFVQARLNEALA